MLFRQLRKCAGCVGPWVEMCVVWILSDKSSCPEVFCKKGVLRNFAKFTGKHLCQENTCEISKNTYFNRTSPLAASEEVHIFTSVDVSKKFRMQKTCD